MGNESTDGNNAISCDKVAVMRIIAIAVLLTVGYIAYIALTHGDGVAFAAFVGGIVGLGGYLVGRRTRLA